MLRLVDLVGRILLYMPAGSWSLKFVLLLNCFAIYCQMFLTLIWITYEKIHLNCGCWWKWRMIIAVNFPMGSRRRSLRKSQLQWDSNLWPLWILLRCSTNWAMKPHIGSEVILLSSYLPVRSEMMWSIYEVIHIWTAVVDESESNNHCSNFSNLSNWYEEIETLASQATLRWKLDLFEPIQLTKKLFWPKKHFNLQCTTFLHVQYNVLIICKNMFMYL